MSDDFDIEGEALVASSDSSALQRMRRLAEECIETEKLADEIEEHLKDLKRKLNQLKTVELPDAMAENGLSSFSTSDGHTIEINDFVSGSLPTDVEKRKVAIHWLSANGAADMIKNEVSVNFLKTQHNEAKSLAAELKDKGLDVDEKETVHSATLQAFGREKLRSGEECPFELLGLYTGRVAKIKVPKGSK